MFDSTQISPVRWHSALALTSVSLLACGGEHFEDFGLPPDVGPNSIVGVRTEGQIELWVLGDDEVVRAQLEPGQELEELWLLEYGSTLEGLPTETPIPTERCRPCFLAEPDRVRNLVADLGWRDAQPPALVLDRLVPDRSTWCEQGTCPRFEASPIPWSSTMRASIGLEISDQEALIGSKAGDLYRFRPDSGVTPFCTLEFSPTAASPVREGALWIGGLEGELVKLDLDRSGSGSCAIATSTGAPEGARIGWIDSTVRQDGSEELDLLTATGTVYRFVEGQFSELARMSLRSGKPQEQGFTQDGGLVVLPDSTVIASAGASELVTIRGDQVTTDRVHINGENEINVNAIIEDPDLGVVYGFLILGIGTITGGRVDRLSSFQYAGVGAIARFQGGLAFTVDGVLLGYQKDGQDCQIDSNGIPSRSSEVLIGVQDSLLIGDSDEDGQLTLLERSVCQ